MKREASGAPSIPYTNILLVQLGDIGDVVLTTPTIRAVKEAYPSARVSILVRKHFGGMLLADPNLHEIVEFEKARGSLLRVVTCTLSCLRQLRQRRYDLVVDLRTGDRGAILSFFTGAAERVGRKGRGKQFWHDFLFTKVISNTPYGPPHLHPGADQSLRIVREIGIDTENSLPRLYISPHDHGHALGLLAEGGVTPATRWVTINPFSRWHYKEWSSEKWGEVIDWLWAKHRITTVLIGSQEEETAAAGIVRGREGYTITMAGKTTLGELAAIISQSSLHLGVDSAAPHIAAALGTPTVTIHGPSDWRSWRLADAMHRIICPALACVPCRRMGCEDSRQSKCLDELEVQTVTAAIAKVVSSGSFTFRDTIGG